MKLRTVLILATMVLGVMLLSGVALARTCAVNPCQGTTGKDSLRGSNSNNEIHGQGSGDLVRGLGGTDWIYGGGGNDDLYGGPSRDGLYGGPGNDSFDGGKGDDYFRAHDYVRHSEATPKSNVQDRTVDVIKGGPGQDTIDAIDGDVDRLSCGSGNDTVYVDEEDTLDACNDVVTTCPTIDDGNCDTPAPPSWAQPPTSAQAGTGRLGEEFASAQLHV
jgi:RTX calcium-binding nonapeptide repeat (4 copies)